MTTGISIVLGVSIFVVFDERLVTGDYQTPVVGPEHKLYKHIVERYKPDARPVKNASDAVVVTFALSLNQLLDLDEKNQILSTSVWIYEEWKDELLVWIAEDFNNQTTLMIPASSIWLPDIFIFNAAGDTSVGFIHVNGSKVAVQNNGRVGWMIPLMVNSACAVDVTYFPYDRQTCTIKFGSWIYDINQLDIILDASTPDLDHYVMNSEYDLENVSLSRGILNSSCCAGDGQHSMIELLIQLKRKSLFYDYIVIAPTIMLCVLTLASFLLPCDKGEKIAIGLTVFLTLYVLQLRIADNVPDTNSTPILGVFMLVVMTFNCVSLIMATVVMNIKRRGDITQCPEIPSWLFALCDKVLGPVVCTLWKTAIPIPLSLLEEIVEHETAFDGPEMSSNDALVSDNRLAQYENSTLQDTWNKNEEIEEDFPHDDENPTKLYSKTNKRHEKCGIRREKYASEVSPIRRTHYEKASLLEFDTDPENDSDNLDRKYQEKKELRDQFKTNHPDKKNTINRKRKRFQMPKESTSHSLQDIEKPNITLCNADIQKHFPFQVLETGEGIRRRKSTEHCEIIQPPKELKECDTASFLPWLADDIPALERAGCINMRKRRWFYVAEVVDKFCFFVYLVLLTGSVFTILFLIPVTFRNSNT